MEPLMKKCNATYALRWNIEGGLIRTVETCGDPLVLEDMYWQLHKFEVHEGYVGKAFARMEPMFLPDVAEAGDFLRTDFNIVGIRSVAWMPDDDDGSLMEFGFLEVLDELPGPIVEIVPSAPQLEKRNRRRSQIEAESPAHGSRSRTRSDPECGRFLLHEPKLLWSTGALFAISFVEDITSETMFSEAAWGKKELLKELDWESWKPSKESMTHRCFSTQRLVFLQDVSVEDQYEKRDLMAKLGVRSVAIVPQDHGKVLHLAYDKKLTSVPAACRVGIFDNVETKKAILEELLKEDEQGFLRKACNDVKIIHEKNGFTPDKLGEDPVEIDQQTDDYWVPRNPYSCRLTGIHPFNCEPPPSLLRKHGFITPNTVHYVRDHGTVPKLSWYTHQIQFTGNFSFPNNRNYLTMGELINICPPESYAVMLNCAGNRRGEQNMIQKGIGFSWGMCAASCAVWTGIPMYRVLEYMGLNSKDKGGNYINYFGPLGELKNGDSTYGASHARERMCDPARHAMLAFMMNGELLHPDHGYPVRLLCPGYIGGRMIKWLSRISASDLEDDNWYHVNDNRVFPKHLITREDVTKANIWTDPSYCINDRNIQSAIFAPTHCEKVNIGSSEATYELQGYAYAGAGRPVHRVEITMNSGRNWRSCTIRRPDELANSSAHEWGQRFAWVHWSCVVPMKTLGNCGEFAVRAWDDSQNVQCERPNWNMMGMMSSHWYRIKVHQEGDSVWFEHPTTMCAKKCYNLSSHSNINMMTKLEGKEVISRGWMPRMKQAVVSVYRPIPAAEEVVDPKEGWEVDVMRWIK